MMIAAHTAAPRASFARAVNTALAAALSLGLCAPALAQDSQADQADQADMAQTRIAAAPSQAAASHAQGARLSAGPVNLLPYDVGGAQNAPVYRLEPVSMERVGAASKDREEAPGFAGLTPAAVIQARCISGGFLKRPGYGAAAPACAPANRSGATLVSGL